MSAPFALNPADPAFVADPVPTYARGRAEHPIYRHPGLPVLSVFRHDDVLDVLRDEQTWSSRFLPPPGSGDERDQSMLGLDPPDHDRLRGLVNRVFTPGRMRALDARLTGLANELLDDAIERRNVDLVEAYSYPLPVIVIAELMGVPTEDRGKFRVWSDCLVENLGEGLGGVPIDPESLRRRTEVSQEMDEYFGHLIEQRRKDPCDDLLTRLGRATDDGLLSKGELLAMLSVMLVAGNETTRNLIGNLTLQLCAHPDQLKRVREDPALIPGAIDEVLRYDSPVQATVRRAARPLTLGDESVKENENVLVWLGSANRDPDAFSDADRFDVGRTPNHHVSFGFGIHYCLGSNLARLEGRIALRELLRRTRSFERSDAAPVERNPSFILRGPKRLPVTLDAA